MCCNKEEFHCKSIGEQKMDPKTIQRIIVGTICSSTKTIVVPVELFDEAAVPPSAIITPVTMSGKHCMIITYKVTS